MASGPAVPGSAPNVRPAWYRLLSLPWLDRTIAFVGTLPLVYVAYLRYEHYKLGLPLVVSTLQTLILLVTMIIRRPPKRITPNPVFWLIAFVATYWPILSFSLLRQGVSLVPHWLTNALAITGFSVMIWARLSLGRNIGFVPAQRNLVGSGAYAFMRHPIYSGFLLTAMGLLLRAWDPRNALLLLLGIFWFIPVKSLIEEDFLRADPEYAAYMQRVRARWIPYLI